MTPGALLEHLEASGIRLAVVDGFLRYRAPVGAYTDELRAVVAPHRQAFIEDWRCWGCGRISRVLYGGFSAVRLCLRCHRRIEAARAAALLLTGRRDRRDRGEGDA